MELLRTIRDTDYKQVFLLPETVHSNIPNRPGEGDYGSWWFARGFLVETARYLKGHPTGLRYDEREHDGGCITVEISIAVDAHHGPVTASFTYTSGNHQIRDSWRLSVNEQPVAEGGSGTPSPKAIGNAVWRTVHQL